MAEAQFISSFRVGDSIALLSGMTGAIVLTNDFGQHVLNGLMAGHSPDQIAKTIAETPQDHAEALLAVNSVLAAWGQAGLLEQNPIGFPDPVEFSPTETPDKLQFGGAGGTGVMSIPDAVLAEQVETILGHMRPLPDRTETRLSVQSDGKGFAVFREGRALSGRIELDAARFVLIHEMAQIACNPKDVAAVFHAGCVRHNGRALVLCGDSGQGKSTLTLGLVSAGCGYLGDDHIPLHRDGKSALAFPTAAGVKHTAWDLPVVQNLQTRYGLTPQNPREGVRYIPLHLASAAQVGEKTPVTALVFPHYHPDATFELRRISPEQALIQSLKAGTRLSNAYKSDIAPLAEFLNHTPAYDLHYSSSEQSIPTCLDLMTSRAR